MSENVKSSGMSDGIQTVSTEYGQVALDEVNGRYWHLNPSAGLVLEVRRCGGDVESAAIALTDHFDVDLGRARTDAAAMFERLEGIRL